MRLVTRLVFMLIPMLITMPILWIIAFGFGGVREANDTCKDIIIMIIEGEP